MSTAKEVFKPKNFQVYQELQDSFLAVGTYFVNRQMYYTAAHERGLWLCAVMANNQIITIGLVPWSNIKNVVIDTHSDNVYIVVNDFEEVMANAEPMFKMYKGSFSHVMMGTTDKAIVLPKDLFSGELLSFLHGKVPTDIREEKLSVKEKRNQALYTIALIAFIVLILFAIFAL